MAKSEALYWASIYVTLVALIGMNLVLAPKFHLSRWKVTVITLLLFAFNWGVSYVTAFIEAGLVHPPSVNGVRAWVYVPLMFYACSLVFRVNVHRLSDMLTPCFVFGFAFGHLGCLITGCCHGYPYEGFGAIYSEIAKCRVFPTQLLECALAFVLFVWLLIHIVKSGYKVTGRLYPIMLIAYSARFFLEFLRDNEKLVGGISSLAFHALFGGLVGAIWLYFITAGGKFCAEKLTLSPNPQLEQAPLVLEKGSKETFLAEVKHLKKVLLAVGAVSALVLVFCLMYLIMLNTVLMATILVSMFTAIAAFLVLYSLTQLLWLYRLPGKPDGASPVIFRLPGQEQVRMLHRKKIYFVKIGSCQSCGQGLKLSEIDRQDMILSCRKNHQCHIRWSDALKRKTD